MEYKRFWISNYRAINGPLEIDVAQSPLTPIIGINECGKTTILSALFAFDSFNDGLNEGRHLKDTHNLYRTDKTSPKISAEICLRIRLHVSANGGWNRRILVSCFHVPAKA